MVAIQKDIIDITDVKKGDYIVLEGSKQCYTVVKHHSRYMLIPVELNKARPYTTEDVEEPDIIDKVFDGKNGACKFYRKKN